MEHVTKEINTLVQSCVLASSLGFNSSSVALRYDATWTLSDDQKKEKYCMWMPVKFFSIATSSSTAISVLSGGNTRVAYENGGQKKRRKIREGNTYHPRMRDPTDGPCRILSEHYRILLDPIGIRRNLWYRIPIGSCRSLETIGMFEFR